MLRTFVTWKLNIEYTLELRLVGDASAKAHKTVVYFTASVGSEMNWKLLMAKSRVGSTVLVTNFTQNQHLK